MGAHRRQGAGAHRVAALLHDDPRADVGGHDQHRVAKVDGAPLAVGEAAVVHRLQQQIEDLRMGLLDLVEQDHAVGLAPHLLGELAALLVADVARRGADQPRHRVALHVLAHVDADQLALAGEQVPGQQLGQLGLAHPGGADEHEAAGGAIRVGHAGVGAQHRVGDRRDRRVLAHQLGLEVGLDRQQAAAVVVDEARQRDAGRLGDHLGHRPLVHLQRQQLEVARRLELLELAAELGQGLVAQPRRRVVVPACGQLVDVARDLRQLLLALLHRLLLGLLVAPDLGQLGELGLGLLDLGAHLGEHLRVPLVLLAQDRGLVGLEQGEAAVELVDPLGLGIELDAQLGGGFVDHVDRLVGEEAVGDVAAGELDRRDDRRVGDPHPMVEDVAVGEPAQDRDRRLLIGLGDEQALEAALERRVLLDVAAILGQGGRADAAQLAARQRRLEHVGRIERPAGRAGAHEDVELVDEQDVVLGILGKLPEHPLEALLELALELGAGEHPGDVEHQHPAVAQALGDLAGDDPLGEPLDDRGLADPGLADQHRVVLGAALEDLHRAADLVVAADEGVELLGARLGGEVDGVLGQRVALLLGVGVGDLLAGAQAGEKLVEAIGL